MKLVLEQRFLFDGSTVSTLHSADVTTKDVHSDPAAAVLGKDGAVLLDGRAVAVDPASVLAAGIAGAPSDPQIDSRLAGHLFGATSGHATTLLVIDPRVTDWHTLAAGLQPDVAVLVLDTSKDGIAQVSAALESLGTLSSLQFLTNGVSGQIALGGTTLDSATAAAHASDIAQWGAHLAGNADIVFWGCDVASGTDGALFLQDIHTLTGASVDASLDPTGAGSNWVLESHLGTSAQDVALPFSATAMDSFSGVLDAPAPTVSISVVSSQQHIAAGTALLGETMNATLSFTNTATSGTGFGPYVELFLPTGVTLTGTPTYNGANLTTSSATVTAGSFTNPHTKTTETAPGGFTAGTMVIIDLPYGSFTPGEPQVDIAAQLKIANTATLVGNPLTIDARGAFRYGAVATGGANLLGSTVTSNTTVELVESWVTVATQPGEGETATGPDFPVTYTLNVEPAPAVSATSTPITNVTMDVQLPNDVIWTGSAVSAPGATSATITSAAGGGGTEQTLHVTYASLSALKQVTFSAYVPRTYQYTDTVGIVGAPILDPTSGAPVTVSFHNYQFSADAWNTLAISNVAGDISGADFLAKSLAVQLVASTSSALPSQDIAYTLNFQVSDYFGVSGLGLNATLGNGLTFDPTAAINWSVTGKNGGPSGSGNFSAGATSTGTFNGETVNTSGGTGPFGYSFIAVTGTTRATFDLGTVLAGTYGAGSTGAVHFSGTVLDKYPTGADNVAGAGGFLRQNDKVSTSSTADTATSLYDFTTGSYDDTGNAIADSTATKTDTLPSGTLTLSVAYVNGVAYVAGQTIKPTDNVVYQLAYTLPDGGDFGDAGVHISTSATTAK